MAIMKVPEGEGEGGKRMRDLLGPGQIDLFVRQALQMLWVGMPKDRKTVDEVEREFRRIVDRALKDIREDSDRFLDEAE